VSRVWHQQLLTAACCHLPLPLLVRRRTRRTT